MTAAMTVAEIMTRSVITLFEEDNLAQVGQGLLQFHVGQLPVVDDGKLVGLLSQSDLLAATLDGRSGVFGFLEGTFVRDLMQTDVMIAHPEDAIADAARRLVDGALGALPVVDAEGMLVGIVTQNDIVRLASHML